MSDRDKIINDVSKHGFALLQKGRFYEASNCFRLISNIVNDAPLSAILKELDLMGVNVLLSEKPR